jgi:aromatic-L-amino-acid/L-tryptophan decarboxylase
MMPIDTIQKKDFPDLVKYLEKCWREQVEKRGTGAVSPLGLNRPIKDIIDEQLPEGSQSLNDICVQIERLVIPYSVQTSHPLFLAYVTPPALDICVLGEAISSMLNQNVSFVNLSPIGTAIEEVVIKWMGSIIGYGATSCGGVLVTGGSVANQLALAVARRSILGQEVTKKGNYVEMKHQRVYCSEHIHRSVYKAAALIGIGTENVSPVPANHRHQINVEDLQRQIDKDKSENKIPTTIIGAAGTRAIGAFDDLEALSKIAKDNQLWLHVDAAFGGALRLSWLAPNSLQYLGYADSVTFDPHKLLFVPFDAGCLLVQDKQRLLDTFGSEGEYLERSDPPGRDIADFGMDLGRSLKALKIWLAMKYIGAKAYGREITRLLKLARQFESLIKSTSEFETLIDGESIIVCFRWKGEAKSTDEELNNINGQIPLHLRRKGLAFINPVSINNKIGLRACLSNFRTDKQHLEELLDYIRECVES